MPKKNKNKKKQHNKQKNRNKKKDNEKKQARSLFSQFKNLNRKMA